MVNKITKDRLKNFVWYNSIKIIVLTVIFSVVLGLLFNFLEKQPTDGQDFRIMIDSEITLGSDIDEIFSDLFTNDELNGGFSYEILKGETVIVRDSDENPKDYLINQIYVPLAYDDITVFYENLNNEAGENGYAYYVDKNNAIDILVYIDNALKYLYDNGFCDENGVFNEQRVYEYFVSTRGSDARFKTSEQIEKGKADELLRLKAIYNNATSLKECFANHLDLLDYREYTFSGVEFKGYYGLKVSKLVGNSENDIKNLFLVKTEDENGNWVDTLDGIYISVGENSKENGDLYYDNLAVLYTLIKRYTNYLWKENL